MKVRYHKKRKKKEANTDHSWKKKDAQNSACCIEQSISWVVLRHACKKGNAVRSFDVPFDHDVDIITARAKTEEERVWPRPFCLERHTHIMRFGTAKVQRIGLTSHQKLWCSCHNQWKESYGGNASLFSQKYWLKVTGAPHHYTYGTRVPHHILFLKKVAMSISRPLRALLVRFAPKAGKTTLFARVPWVTWCPNMLRWTVSQFRSCPLFFSSSQKLSTEPS